MKKKQKIFRMFVISVIILIVFSFLKDINFGKQASKYLGKNILEMLQILPCAFILISLFDNWVSRERVEKHLGSSSGIIGYLWVLFLGGMSVGGAYVVFPLAESLRRKGASLKVVFAYLGFGGIMRIPMTMFELTFLGPKFTAVRLLTAIPLALISGILLGKALEKKEYQINEQKV